MKKLKYKMGIYFEVEYFVDKNFNRLIQSFLVIKKEFEKENPLNNEELMKKGYKIINNNYNEYIMNQKKFLDKRVDEEVQLENDEDKNKEVKKEQSQKYNQNQGKEKEDVILLSRYNSVIIKTKTLEELSKKINDMKNKKFIIPNNVIPKNDSKNYY